MPVGSDDLPVAVVGQAPQLMVLDGSADFRVDVVDQAPQLDGSADFPDVADHEPHPELLDGSSGDDEGGHTPQMLLPLDVVLVVPSTGLLEVVGQKPHTPLTVEVVVSVLVEVLVDVVDTPFG